MKTLQDIIDRDPEPAPWSEGDNIPWDDPEFSERMLAEHLSQDHDLASRRSETIDQQAEWIFSSVLDSRAARVLDLACGPGLYANRLAKKKCEYVGIDFSPASIRHAQEIAAAEHLSCTFLHADVRDVLFGEDFDLVMMIYGQFNVFQRHQGLGILKKAHEALRPGGALLLEVQPLELIQKGGEAGPSWYSAQSGLFSAEPHVVLQENFWDADARASTNRFSIIDARTGSVSTCALSNEAYTEEELDDALHAAGFGEVQIFPSLTGLAASGEADLSVVVARRRRT
jgi:SAM-dependent methyltransferase